MTDTAAEQAIRSVCEQVLAGDYVNAMSQVTPEALAQVMSLGAGMMNLPQPEGYEIKGGNEVDGEFRFQVCFYAEAQELHATVGLREVDGTWLISSVEDVQIS